MYIHIYIYTYIYMYMYICINIHVPKQKACSPTCDKAYTIAWSCVIHACMYHIHKHTTRQTNKCNQMTYVHAYICIHTYTHTARVFATGHSTHTLSFTHSRTQTQTHTHTQQYQTCGQSQKYCNHAFFTMNVDIPLCMIVRFNDCDIRCD